MIKNAIFIWGTIIEKLLIHITWRILATQPFRYNIPATIKPVAGRVATQRPEF
jgi:hypothetical protein